MLPRYRVEEGSNNEFGRGGIFPLEQVTFSNPDWHKLDFENLSETKKGYLKRQLFRHLDKCIFDQEVFKHIGRNTQEFFDKLKRCLIITSIS